MTDGLDIDSYEIWKLIYFAFVKLSEISRDLGGAVIELILFVSYFISYLSNRCVGDTIDK